jgi:hypothetical protein
MRFAVATWAPVLVIARDPALPFRERPVGRAM